MLQSLTNRRVLLGVTGGIAAYKAAEVIRRLKDADADVKVVMTKAAQEFITPLTLQALSGNPVHVDLLDPAAEAAMGHIELARWADIILIAPASANFIARLNAGMADDLLTTVCLASVAKKAVAPAMNQAMWLDEQTQQNIASLTNKGIYILGPNQGLQACGDVGPGRMLEPFEIAGKIAGLFQGNALSGKHVVITAGPTREAIDPVRFISNHSSGKMGFALAQAAVDAGAKVTLISGPVNLPTPERLTRINVESTEDMLEASLQAAQNADIFIGSAAVADYRVKDVANEKIKKSAAEIQLSLIKNPDIISRISQLIPKPFVVGFAAETSDVLAYARKKRLDKKLDMIVANDVSDKSIGFNSENNAVTIINSTTETTLAEANKSEIARQILAMIAEQIKQ